MPNSEQDLNQSDPGKEGASVYPMRLQKFLARAGVASRRGSEDLMTAGRVRVNGEVVTKLGSKVDPLHDVVEVDETIVPWGSVAVYIMLNKPAGYITTMNDPQGRPCVASLVPIEEYPGLYPVGRLDRATCGLLLFTTNGEVGHGLLHPKHHVDKTYLAWVEGQVAQTDLQRFEAGIMLDDGPAAPAQATIEGTEDSRTLLRITIHEGRNRQVRRMCGAIGHECLSLQRISFGPLELGDLAEGSWRKLSEEELSALMLAAGQSMLE